MHFPPGFRPNVRLIILLSAIYLSACEDKHPIPPDKPTLPKQIYQGDTYQFSNLTQNNLPTGLNTECMDVEAADMDNDGDIDLVLAIEFGNNILLNNNGEGHFSRASPGLPKSSRDSEDIGISDFDNNGHPDILFVSEDDQINELFLNMGDGSYRDASERLPTSGVSNAAVVSDLNNDGATDIIIGNVGEQALLINNGLGFFKDETENRLGLASYRVQDLALADIDGDGDLDLLTADERQNRIFINDGSGHFKDETEQRLPAFLDETREVISADIDNDGDMDIYYANVSFEYPADRRNRLLVNNGNGVFEEVTDRHLSSNPAIDNFSARFIELNGDNAIDLIVPYTIIFEVESGGYLSYINEGNGKYQRAVLSPELPEGNGFDIAEADFNGDGLNDYYFCNRGVGKPGTDSIIGGQDSLLLRTP